MKEIKGICPILAAPFTQDGEVDLESLKKLTAALIEQGCHGVTLFGIAGEYYKLSDAERQAMAEAVVEVCRQKDGTSILSVTDHATEKAVQTAQRYEALGADCLMLLPPFFLKPGASYVYTHMKAVAQSVDLPIMVQYAPEQTGVTIPPDMLKRLGEECPNVKYYKIECKPPGLYITQMMKLTEG